MLNIQFKSYNFHLNRLAPNVYRNAYVYNIIQHCIQIRVANNILAQGYTTVSLRSSKQPTLREISLIFFRQTSAIRCFKHLFQGCFMLKAALPFKTM